MLSSLVRAVRPEQWVKNVFVLAPLVFAQRLLDPPSVLQALGAFAAFCLASSCVYLFNDIRDRTEDRRHPLKKNRPIASGALGVGQAAGASVALGAAGLGIALVLGTLTALFLILYLVLNLLYSNGLKRVVVLDVLIVSLGFVLRIRGGAAAVAVAVSPWLLLCTVFVSLLLALSKRRHELLLLTREAAEQRTVLQRYSPEFLDQMINVVTASSVLSYALYCIAPGTVEKFGTRHMVYTVPFVLFGIFRYLYLIYQRPSERNPTEAMLRDPAFAANMLLWGLTVLGLIYLS